MLMIRVLGKGLIPRGLGIAPRMDAVSADLTTISTIMQTRGLTVEAINPETGKPITLTQHNVKRIWDKYGRVPYKKPAILNTNEKPEILTNERKKEHKEPAVYQPKNNPQQPSQGYKEVTKDVIHDAVEKAADKIIGSADKKPEEDQAKQEEVKPEESAQQPEKKEEEKAEQPKNNNHQNNGKPQQGFKPVNNPKK